VPAQASEKLSKALTFPCIPCIPTVFIKTIYPSHTLLVTVVLWVGSERENACVCTGIAGNGAGRGRQR